MTFASKAAKAKETETGSVRHLCSTCKREAVMTLSFLAGRPCVGTQQPDQVVHQCLVCYERRRVKTPIEIKMEAEAEKWKRRDGESIDEYRARIMDVMKGMRGPRRVNQPEERRPADASNFEEKPI